MAVKVNKQEVDISKWINFKTMFENETRYRSIYIPRKQMCVCVCIYLHTHIFVIYVCIYIYNIYIHTQGQVYTHTYTQIYIYNDIYEQQIKRGTESNI